MHACPPAAPGPRLLSCWVATAFPAAPASVCGSHIWVLVQTARRRRRSELPLSFPSSLWSSPVLGRFSTPYLSFRAGQGAFASLSVAGACLSGPRGEKSSRGQRGRVRAAGPVFVRQAPGDCSTPVTALERGVTTWTRQSLSFDMLTHGVHRFCSVHQGPVGHTSMTVPGPAVQRCAPPSRAPPVMPIPTQ